MQDPKIELWPDWKIVGVIGEGSFGKVFEIHRKNGSFLEKSALKYIRIPSNPADLLRLREAGLREENTEEYLSSHVDEIRNEIGVMQRFVGYSNIVSYEDYRIIKHKDDVGWDILIRMELLTSLSSYMMTHTISEEMVMQIGMDISQALAILHGAGVIHRDIKPQNIFINDRGFFKLGDFGISRSVSNTSFAMSFKGTVAYMAPETFTMRGTDARSDIYSLALVLYKCLNGGRDPFLPSGPFGLSQKEEAQNKRLRGTPLPEPLYGSRAFTRVILTALKPDPANRYQTAADFHKAIRQVANDKTGRTVEVHRMVQVNMHGSNRTPGQNTASQNMRNHSAQASAFLRTGSRAAGTGSRNIPGKAVAVKKPGNTQTGRSPGYVHSQKSPASVQNVSVVRPAKEKNGRRVVLIACAVAAGILLLISAMLIWKDGQKKEISQETEYTDYLPSPSWMKKEASSATVTTQTYIDSYTGTDADDLVVFEDSALEEAVRAALEMKESDPLTVADAAGITSLELSGENRDNSGKITSLTGLSAFYNLENLDLSGNLIENIEELSSMTSLRHLDLSGNRIMDVTALGTLSSLGYLDLMENEISEVESLLSLYNLYILDISKNVISSIDGISALSGLKLLYVSDNQITDIRPVESLRELVGLTAGDNMIDDISALKQLKELTLLYLQNNRIEDISPVAELDKLEYLAIFGNPIRDYGPLDKLPSSVEIYRD